MALADLAAALGAHLDPTPVLLGPEHLTDNAAPPRVVVVPTSSGFEGALQGDEFQRSLLTHVQRLAVHCWGALADYSDAEALRDAVLVAIDGFAEGSFDVAGGSWLNAGASTWFKSGRVYVLELELRIPVVRPADPTVTVTAADNDPSGTVRGDGLLDSGES